MSQNQLEFSFKKGKLSHSFQMNNPLSNNDCTGSTENKNFSKKIALCSRKIKTII